MYFKIVNLLIFLGLAASCGKKANKNSTTASETPSETRVTPRVESNLDNEDIILSDDISILRSYLEQNPLEAIGGEDSLLYKAIEHQRRDAINFIVGVLPELAKDNDDGLPSLSNELNLIISLDDRQTFNDLIHSYEMNQMIILKKNEHRSFVQSAYDQGQDFFLSEMLIHFAQWLTPFDFESRISEVFFPLSFKIIQLIRIRSFLSQILSQVAVEGDLSALRFLFRRHADLGSYVEEDFVLKIVNSELITEKKIEILDIISPLNPNWNGDNRFDRRIPLFAAIKAGDYDLVQALINFGADIEVQSQFSGHTPISLAAYEFNVELVIEFKRRGANLRVRLRQPRSNGRFIISSFCSFYNSRRFARNNVDEVQLGSYESIKAMMGCF